MGVKGGTGSLARKRQGRCPPHLASCRSSFCSLSPVPAGRYPVVWRHTALTSRVDAWVWVLVLVVVWSGLDPNGCSPLWNPCVHSCSSFRSVLRPWHQIAVPGFLVVDACLGGWLVAPFGPLSNRSLSPSSPRVSLPGPVSLLACFPLRYPPSAMCRVTPPTHSPSTSQSWCHLPIRFRTTSP